MSGGSLIGVTPTPTLLAPMWHRSNVIDDAYVDLLPPKIFLKIIGSIFVCRLIFLAARVEPWKLFKMPV
jgi:hypothetical protein